MMGQVDIDGLLEAWRKRPLIERLFAIGRYEEAQGSKEVRVQSWRVEVECAASADEVAREIVRQEDASIGAARHRRDAVELAYLLQISRERLETMRLAAMGSGWDNGVCAFIRERVDAVYDDWAGRWKARGKYPSFVDFAVEVRRWCDSYADVLVSLPSLLDAANKRREGNVEHERKRADAEKARYDEALAQNERMISDMANKVNDAYERGKRDKYSELRRTMDMTRKKKTEGK